jgi:hypothetical protein
VLWELWAAGLADADLGERRRATTAGWRDLIESVVTEKEAPHRAVLDALGLLIERAEASNPGP